MSTGEPVITTPGNGKKWWQEVWGKVVAGLILIAIPTLIAFLWRAVPATADLYDLPPRVDALEMDVLKLKAMAPSEATAQRLIDALDREAEAREKRGGKK